MAPNKNVVINISLDCTTIIITFLSTVLSLIVVPVDWFQESGFTAFANQY